MYIPSSAQQTYVFLMCIGFGFVVGIFYHLLRFIRKAFFTFKAAVLIQDILFCVISAFSVFCFLLCCNDGQIRLFVLCGLALGLFVYYVSFGFFVSKFLDDIALTLHKLMSPLRCVFLYLFTKVKNNTHKIEKTFKKTSN